MKLASPLVFPDNSVQSTASVSAGAKGSGIANFGGGAGTNMTTAVITGQTGISSDSIVNCVVMANGSTATHNAYEHGIVPLTLRCISIIPGVGFTVQIASEWRLTGSFAFRWTWN